MGDSYNSKVIIVGDGAIGKTCLLSRLCEPEKEIAGFGASDLPAEYEPTTFNNFNVEWETTDGTQLSLELWDTAGQEGFEELRKLSYPGTEIYIVAYACNSEITLKNVEFKWIPEIQRNLENNNPEAWIILVGTKVDIRTEDEGVSRAQAEKVASDIGAIGFVETSALSGIGIQDVMKQIIQKAVDKAQNKELTVWNEGEDADVGLKGSTVKEDNSYKEKPKEAGPVTNSSAKPAGVKEDDGCCVVM